MTRSVPAEEQWVRRFHPAPKAATQLVCFPHAGGSASFYFPTSRAMAPHSEVLAVQYPGRQDRRAETAFEDVTALADAATAALLPALDRPFAIFGHSMGASVAFEVANRLEAVGAVPEALFVSGRRAPSRFRRDTVHLQDDDALIAEVAGLSGARSEALRNEEILRMVLPAIRSDYTAAETYCWGGGEPLTTPIHAHVGDADPKAELADVQAWQHHTTGEFTMTTYPGGHFYLDECAVELTRAIASTLARRST